MSSRGSYSLPLRCDDAFERIKNSLLLSAYFIFVLETHHIFDTKEQKSDMHDHNGHIFLPCYLKCICTLILVSDLHVLVASVAL